MGQIGISYEEFCMLDPEEFSYICKAYREQEEGRIRDRWQRMRILADIVIQPHIKNKISPEQLLPLPWDEDLSERREHPKLDVKEQRKRMQELVRKLDKK